MTDTANVLTSTSTKLNLSSDQKQVLFNITSWIQRPDSPYLTVGGYAGTGKTTLVGILRKILHQNTPKNKIAFACFTGKASQILRQKLIDQQALYPGDFIGTIHQLMYMPKTNKHGQIISWERNKVIKQQMIIIDEASMVTSEIWQDLLSYKIPIIAIGDHGQLPPIGDHFNLMKSPQLRLEKIHRQAEGNPILEVATIARETGQIPFKKFSSLVQKIPANNDAEYFCNDIYSSYKRKSTLILCGRNKTRVALNHTIRTQLDYREDRPESGEQLICLKNNYENIDGPIYNGMVGQLKSLRDDGQHWYESEIYFPDEDRTFIGTISKHQFHQPEFLKEVDGLHYKQIGERFDFGYALTVHKAQGSQAERVLLFEEPNSYMSPDIWRRWLYTAVTRATHELYIISRS